MAKSLFLHENNFLRHSNHVIKYVHSKLQHILTLLSTYSPFNYMYVKIPGVLSD